MRKKRSDPDDPRESQDIPPPFSGKLKWDKELKLKFYNKDKSEPKSYEVDNTWTSDTLRSRLLEQKVGKAADLTNTDKLQLLEKPVYPTDYVLAQFAAMAYKDDGGNSLLLSQEELLPPKKWWIFTGQLNKRLKEISDKLKNNEIASLEDVNSYIRQVDEALQGKSDGQTDKYTELKSILVGKQLQLSGWQLLTTASNFSTENGYFGAAYWNANQQQIVIAHRGTKPTNPGADWADVKGVLFNNYVAQMNSASTFAAKVLEIVHEPNKKPGLNFQVSFTGHSLGGWLAQITTFTTKYRDHCDKMS